MATQRRRRVAPESQAAEPESSSPGVTADDDSDNDERWAGDPNEEPANESAEEVPEEKPAPAAGRRLRKPTDPAKASAPGVDANANPWGVVITDVFSIDIDKTYTRLQKNLSLGDKATEYGTVLSALDQSARNLFDAVRLTRVAKAADEKLSAELGLELEVLRSAAIEQLVSEQKQGLRSKAPTLEDIKDRVLRSWPDKSTALNRRKAEMHGAMRAVEGLVDAWRERCQILRKMADQFKSSGA